MAYKSAICCVHVSLAKTRTKAYSSQVPSKPSDVLVSTSVFLTFLSGIAVLSFILLRPTPTAKRHRLVRKRHPLSLWLQSSYESSGRLFLRRFKREDTTLHMVTSPACLNRQATDASRPTHTFYNFSNLHLYIFSLSVISSQEDIYCEGSRPSAKPPNYATAYSCEESSFHAESVFFPHNLSHRLHVGRH